MLHIHFGSMDGEVYDPATYFLNQYDDDWITTDFVKEMILDVDRSEVISTRVIDSPVLGPITPRELSGGVKTLILMALDESGRIFNASACGDNCAKWILEIAKKKDLTVTLHNIMKFDFSPLEIHILNSGQTVHSFRDYVFAAIDYV
ncbi:MAG: DUF4869 domain-containing protein [Lachnospiraceae bacterium]|nr:DUF4869 domain-containing protein [Lachnospiraceae bacterium]